MRFPIPQRFDVRLTTIFIFVVVIAQRLEGTDITFSLLCGIYIALFSVAFRLGGGLFFLAGSFVFFNGVSSAILGIVYKILTGEPGESNLHSPNRLMLAYCLGMAGMALAAGLSQRLIPRRGLLSGMAAGESMKKAAIGCFVLGVALQLGTGGGLQDSGSLASAIGQINHFIQMAIILGTTYEIVSSEGKRSTNWVVWVAGLWLFVFGAIVFSKDGMFISLFSWAIPCVTLRYNFSRKQILMGTFGIFLMLHYLVPFSQYGRAFRTEEGGSNTRAALALLSHPEATRALYLETEVVADDSGGPHYYDEPQGLMDREQMLAFDDALIDYTAQGNVRSLEPLIQEFEAIVPRFLWANKPIVFSGNEFAREIDVLSQEDLTTGISFSPIGDAYHEAEWFGVGVVLPIVLFMLFFIGDSLAGDTRISPWGLLLIALAATAAPEGLMQGSVYLMSYGAFAVAVIALLARYVLPVVANLLTGSERTRVRRTMEFRPLVRGSRLNPLLREPDSETPPSNPVAS